MSEKEHVFRYLKAIFISFLVNCFYMNDVKTNRVGVFGIMELHFYWDDFFYFPGRESFSGFLLCVSFIFCYTFFCLIKSDFELDQEPMGKQ